MAEETPRDEAPEQLALASGYCARVSAEDRGSLEVRAPDGRICVSIRLTEAGPVVEIAAAELRIASQGELELKARRLSIESAESLSLATAGDLSLRAGGALRTSGFEQSIEATRGDVVIDASDDVKIDGERIRLNSPDPAPIRRYPSLGRAKDPGADG